MSGIPLYENRDRALGLEILEHNGYTRYHHVVRGKAAEVKRTSFPERLWFPLHSMDHSHANTSNVTINSTFTWDFK